MVQNNETQTVDILWPEKREGYPSTFILDDTALPWQTG